MRKFLFVIFSLFLTTIAIPRSSLAQVPTNSWECVVGPGGTCRPNTSTANCTGNNEIPDTAIAYCAQFQGPANTAQCNSAGGACVAANASPSPSYICGGYGEPCCPGFTCDPGITCNTRTGTCGNPPPGGGGPGASPSSAEIPSCSTSGGGTGIDTAIGCIPIGDSNQFISFILRWAIGIGGGIAFLLIIYASFMIMSSRGNPERLKAGQELLTSAIAGIIMLIFSIFILRVIGVNILGIFQ